jgi:glycosyltransferase involved in cell wall biosynthesis
MFSARGLLARAELALLDLRNQNVRSQGRLMKILCVNSVISDHGGAEFAAMNLASRLADRGHEVHFLGSKNQESRREVSEQGIEGFEPIRFGKVHLHYREFPRTYPLGEKHRGLRKLLWHLQDAAYPTNEALFAEVLRQVEPDAIILHSITAIGSNIWRTIRKSGIPCIQVLHDLGLICLNKARFKGGRQCPGLCAACRIQKLYRISLIAAASNFSFVSPSHAILNEVERFVDLSAWRREVIPNPNTFVIKPRNVSESERPRILYVGRLDSAKGVDVMLESAARAHEIVEFDFDILGTGLMEQPLRQRYAHKNWIRFQGRVDQDTVAEFMSRATVLLVPSLWLENAPVVIVHALFAGLPVLGSRIGGIPEYVADGRTGRLLPPGDKNAWSAEIARVVSDKEQVATWSAACSEAVRQHDPDASLDAYEKLLQEMVAEGSEKLSNKAFH